VWDRAAFEAEKKALEHDKKMFEERMFFKENEAAMVKKAEVTPHAFTREPLESLHAIFA
jgi:hypothetical protein